MLTNKSTKFTISEVKDTYINNLPKLIYIPDDFINWNHLKAVWSRVLDIENQLSKIYTNRRYVEFTTFKSTLKKIVGHRNIVDLPSDLEKYRHVSGIYKLNRDMWASYYINIDTLDNFLISNQFLKDLPPHEVIKADNLLSILGI